MTKIVSYYPKYGYKLPRTVAGAGNSTMETTKGQPAAEYVDDARIMLSMHFLFTWIMLVFFLVPALLLWARPRDWHCFAIHGIGYLYSAVMINLLIIKRRGQKKTCELEKGCGEEFATEPQMQLTSILMLVATAVTLISLVLMVLVFQPNWHHLALIVLLISVSTSLMVLILPVAEFEWERALAYEKMQRLV